MKAGDTKSGTILHTAAITKHWLKYTEKCLVFIDKFGQETSRCVVQHRLDTILNAHPRDHSVKSMTCQLTVIYSIYYLKHLS